MERRSQEVWSYGGSSSLCVGRSLSLTFMFVFVDTFVVISVVTVNLVDIFECTSQLSKAIALFSRMTSSMVQVHAMLFLVCAVGSRPVVEPGVGKMTLLMPERYLSFFYSITRFLMASSCYTACDS
jgi:hypothetical protein